ncbi:MAG TPA: phage baseplate assembly protein V [Acetobacteraceae bacterium]|jgi:phage gp45-like|nr:phage baseplate assembly protein V [Acetobacteraceae bacterium]
MERFLNALKAQAGALDQAAGQPRFGLVTSVDPDAATARVQLQPEGVLSGWLPILSAWVGAGWGMACPPSPGDQVLVLSQEGDSEHGVIVGRAFSDTQRAPAAPVGELWLVHKGGSFLKLANDGTVQVKGDLHVDGDVYDRHGSLDRLRQHYDAHTHGGGATPSPQD